MTLQDIGSIGELVGALATVATLAYLAVQVRQNSIQLDESARLTRLSHSARQVDSFSRHRHLMAQPGNAELYIRGLESYSALNAAEKVRFRALLEEYFFAYRATFERLKLGYDYPNWTVQARGAALLLKTTGGAEWWNDRKAIFGQEFAQEMEKQARLKDTT